MNQALTEKILKNIRDLSEIEQLQVEMVLKIWGEDEKTMGEQWWRRWGQCWMELDAEQQKQTTFPNTKNIIKMACEALLGEPFKKFEQDNEGWVKIWKERLVEWVKEDPQGVWKMLEKGWDKQWNPRKDWIESEGGVLNQEEEWEEGVKEALENQTKAIQERSWTRGVRESITMMDRQDPLRKNYYWEYHVCWGSTKEVQDVERLAWEQGWWNSEESKKSSIRKKSWALMMGHKYWLKAWLHQEMKGDGQWEREQWIDLWKDLEMLWADQKSQESREISSMYNEIVHEERRDFRIEALMKTFDEEEEEETEDKLFQFGMKSSIKKAWQEWETKYKIPSWEDLWNPWKRTCMKSREWIFWNEIPGNLGDEEIQNWIEQWVMQARDEGVDWGWERYMQSVTSLNKNEWEQWIEKTKKTDRTSYIEWLKRLRSTETCLGLSVREVFNAQKEGRLVASWWMDLWLGSGGRLKEGNEWESNMEPQNHEWVREAIMIFSGGSQEGWDQNKHWIRSWLEETPWRWSEHGNWAKEMSRKLRHVGESSWWETLQASRQLAGQLERTLKDSSKQDEEEEKCVQTVKTRDLRL